MNELKVYAKLKHFSAEVLPFGDLPLASLPADVAAAVDRLRHSLQRVDTNNAQAVRKVVEDPDLYMDAPMDTAMWEIAIDCQNGEKLKFHVAENCGRTDTTTLMNYLEATLPKVRRDSFR